MIETMVEGLYKGVSSGGMWGDMSISPHLSTLNKVYMFMFIIVTHYRGFFFKGEATSTEAVKILNQAGKAGMRRGVLMTILQQNAAQLPMFMGKASDKYGVVFLFMEYLDFMFSRSVMP